MKAIKKIVAVVGFFALLMAGTSCEHINESKNYQTPPPVYLTVVVDVSDSLTVVPQVAHVRRLIEGNSKSAVFLTIRLASDVRNDITFEEAFPAYDPRESNEMRRNLDIAHFCKKVEKAFQELIALQASYAHTSLWNCVMEEAGELRQHPSAIRYLHVYSNGLENSGNLNFLESAKNDVLSQIESEDEGVWNAVPGHELVSDLSGIDVVWYHRPRNNQADRHFHSVLDYFKKRFEERGASFTLKGGELTLKASGNEQ